MCLSIIVCIKLSFFTHYHTLSACDTNTIHTIYIILQRGTRSTYYNINYYVSVNYYFSNRELYRNIEGFRLDYRWLDFRFGYHHTDGYIGYIGKGF